MVLNYHNINYAMLSYNPTVITISTMVNDMHQCKLRICIRLSNANLNMSFVYTFV